MLTPKRVIWPPLSINLEFLDVRVFAARACATRALSHRFATGRTSQPAGAYRTWRGASRTCLGRATKPRRLDLSADEELSHLRKAGGPADSMGPHIWCCEQDTSSSLLSDKCTTVETNAKLTVARILWEIHRPLRAPSARRPASISTSSNRIVRLHLSP